MLGLAVEEISLVWRSEGFLEEVGKVIKQGKQDEEKCSGFLLRNN